MLKPSRQVTDDADDALVREPFDRRAVEPKLALSAVCSPNAGAGLRNPPGVTDSRGITLCICASPICVSGRSTRISRPIARNSRSAIARIEAEVPI